MKTLNPKQEAFCREYIIDSNGTQAAIRAGYSAKTADVKASQLLGIVKIQDCIAKMRYKIQEQTNITIENTVRFIKDVSEQARDDEDLTNALKGADMLMKHLGGYTLDNKISNDTTHTLVFETLPKK